MATVEPSPQQVAAAARAQEADGREANREAIRRVMVSEPDSVARECGYQEGFEDGARWRARRSQPAPRTVTVEDVRAAESAIDDLWLAWNDWPGSEAIMQAVVAHLGITVEGS